jgi:hypothetical protein
MKPSMIKSSANIADTKNAMRDSREPPCEPASLSARQMSEAPAACTASDAAAAALLMAQMMESLKILSPYLNPQTNSQKFQPQY